jgi:hypothetical protein
MAKSTSTSAPPPTQSRAPATPAAVVSAQLVPVKASDIMPRLLSELQKADHIIIAMLNAMTTAQKSKVHAKLDAAGASGEGMTRHHERRAVIVAAEVALAQPAAVQVRSDPGDTTSGARDANDPMSLAFDAVDATDLGVCIIDELETLFRTIKALSAVSDVSQEAMQTQLATIRGIARLAVDFAADRGDTFSFYRDGAHETLAALRGAA